MRFVRTAAVLAAFSILITSCEEGPGFENVTEPTPGVASFTINPDTISFDPDEDGLEDQEVSIEVMIEPDEPVSDLEPRLVMRQQDDTETYFESPIGNWNEDTGRFEDEVQVEFFPAQIRNYELYLYMPVDNKLGDRGQQTILVDGFPAEPPVVEEVDHPEEIQIPDSGEDQFVIAARVTHPYGSDNIQRVELDIYDEDDVQLGGEPFQLNPQDELGDDWYAAGFPIDQDNVPEVYRLEFYATDIAGGVSDTLTSQMEFVR